MLFPKTHLNTVVAIELPNEDGTFRCIATGFLCGFLTGKKNDEGKDLYRIFLVTNYHVFNKQDVVFIRFNYKDESKRFQLDLLKPNGEKIWSSHKNPNIDLAVVPISAEWLKKENVTYNFFAEQYMAFSNKINELGITQGDGIFVLGYPMGKAGKMKNYAIVRGGIIARLDEEIIKNEHGFLIDSLVFPGNSGGPVILKPEIASIEGTKPVDESYLLGVVKSYIQYTETAYSLQQDPPQPRIQFMENSGLAHVVPLDYVKEIVDSIMPKEKNEPNKEMGTEKEITDKTN